MKLLSGAGQLYKLGCSVHSSCCVSLRRAVRSFCAADDCSYAFGMAIASAVTDRQLHCNSSCVVDQGMLIGYALGHSCWSTHDAVQ